ncbi:hypothetical protein CTI10_023575 [Delftia acidovorans]|nr:hypothetical protein CTI10_023575 [Delftia acidovorans]
MRTGTGQRSHHRLPDGSEIELDARSAADIAYSDTRRLVRLREGALLAQVAASAPGQPLRPFVVQSAQGTAQALGTRFVAPPGRRQHPGACAGAQRAAHQPERPAAPAAGGPQRLDRRRRHPHAGHRPPGAGRLGRRRHRRARPAAGRGDRRAAALPGRHHPHQPRGRAPADLRRVPAGPARPGAAGPGGHPSRQRAPLGGLADGDRRARPVRLNLFCAA